MSFVGQKRKRPADDGQAGHGGSHDGRRKKAAREMEEEEADFERPRVKAAFLRNDAPRLPIKMTDGTVKLAEARPDRPGKDEEDEEEDKGANIDFSLMSKKEKKKAKLKARIEEKKQQAAKKREAKEGAAATSASSSSAKDISRGKGAGRQQQEDEDGDDAEEGSGSDDDEDDDDDEDKEEREAEEEDGKAEGRSAPVMEQASWKQFAALTPYERDARRDAMKATIAALAEAITADPEHNCRDATATEIRKAALYADLKSGGGGGGKSKQATLKAAKRKMEGKKKNSLLELHRLCSDFDPFIRSLAMLSCVAVFRDIVPSYRIRLPTAAERKAQQEGGPGAGRVSKEVKKLRDFESALLTGYQRFLRYLEATVQKGEQASGRIARGQQSQHERLEEEEDDDEEGEEEGFTEDRRYDPVSAELQGKGGGYLPQKQFQAKKMEEKRHKKAAAMGVEFYQAPDAVLASLAETSVKAMCELLKALPHFNFRSNLIGFVVPRMAAREPAVAKLCLEAVGDVFSSDAQGEASHELVRALNAVVKKASQRRGGLERLTPAMLSTLCRLRLNILEKSATELSREQQLKDAKKQGKKSKKGSHHGEDPFDEKDVLAGFQAADAEGIEERRRTAAATLRDALNIFFRVLRNPSAQHLMPPILQGLARFGHLIDVGVTADLVSSLKELLRFAAATDDGVKAGTGVTGSGAGGGDDDDDEDEDAGSAAAEAAGAGAGGAGNEAHPDTFGARGVARRLEGEGGVLLGLAGTSSSSASSSAAAAAAEALGLDATSAAAAAAALGAGSGGSGGSKGRLSTEAVFNCVLTALRILSGPGELLNADDAMFVSAAYAALLRLVGDAHTGLCYTSVPLAIQAVTALFLEKREEYSHERVAAFAKRLSLVAPHLPAPLCMALLSLIRQLCGKYPAIKGLINASPSVGGASSSIHESLVGVPSAADAAALAALAAANANGKKKKKNKSKGEAASSVLFTGTLGDRHLDALAEGLGGAVRAADGSESLSSSLWTVCFLADKHYHPHVRNAAAAALRLNPVLPSEAPNAVIAAYDDREGKLNPAVPAPRPHPLDQPPQEGEKPKGAYLKPKAIAPWLLQSFAHHDILPQLQTQDGDEEDDGSKKAQQDLSKAVAASSATSTEEDAWDPTEEARAVLIEEMKAASTAPGKNSSNNNANASANFINFSAPLPSMVAPPLAPPPPPAAASSSAPDFVPPPPAPPGRPRSSSFMFHFMEKMQERNERAAAVMQVVTELKEQWDKGREKEKEKEKAAKAKKSK